MGRNGKNPAVFSQMVDFVNTNVGKTVTSNEILLGKTPGRNSETAYLYKFLRLGYVGLAVKGSSVINTGTKYKILKPFPDHYNSIMLMEEIKIAKGLIPEYTHRLTY